MGARPVPALGDLVEHERAEALVLIVLHQKVLVRGAYGIGVVLKMRSRQPGRVPDAVRRVDDGNELARDILEQSLELHGLRSTGPRLRHVPHEDDDALHRILPAPRHRAYPLHPGDTVAPLEPRDPLPFLPGKDPEVELLHTVPVLRYHRAQHRTSHQLVLSEGQSAAGLPVGVKHFPGGTHQKDGVRRPHEEDRVGLESGHGVGDLRHVRTVCVVRRVLMSIGVSGPTVEPRDALRPTLGHRLYQTINDRKLLVSCTLQRTVCPGAGENGSDA